jgi:hypothetical protein
MAGNFPISLYLNGAISIECQSLPKVWAPASANHGNSSSA